MADSPELCIDFSDFSISGLCPFSVAGSVTPLLYIYVALMQELFTVNIMSHEDCTGSMVKL